MRKSVGRAVMAVLVLSRLVASTPGGQDFLWMRQFGSPERDEPTAVCGDVSGIYVVGLTLGALPGQRSQGDADAFVRKYDAVGGELWTRQSGTGKDDGAQGVWADSTGVYVVGDSFLSKYDGHGGELWTEELPQADHPSGIAGDPTGLYVAGYAEEELPYASFGPNWDGFVRKYDKRGNELWRRELATAAAVTQEGVYLAGAEQVLGVCADTTGVYVTGYTTGALPGHPAPKGLAAASGFLIKYDASGGVLWRRQFSVKDPTEGRAVSSPGQAVYVGGRGGLQGGFVRKYNAAGKALWTKQLRDVEVNAVCADASGVYVTGDAWLARPERPAEHTYYPFVRKYHRNGGELWTKLLSSTPISHADGVWANSTGAYVVGHTRRALPGQSNAGLTDAFVAKLRPGG